jgi:hypothetical protein
LVCALAVNDGARADDILRGGRAAAQPGVSAGAGGAASTAANTPVPKASDTLARAAQAIAAVQAMQAAARSAAIAGPNNLGADPIHLGKTLPNVPDGLVAGGLMRASGDDAMLWQGANSPRNRRVAAKRTSLSRRLRSKRCSPGKASTSAKAPRSPSTKARAAAT